MSRRHTSPVRAMPVLQVLGLFTLAVNLRSDVREADGGPGFLRAAAIIDQTSSTDPVTVTVTAPVPTSSAAPATTPRVASTAAGIPPVPDVPAAGAAPASGAPAPAAALPAVTVTATATAIVTVTVNPDGTTSTSGPSPASVASANGFHGWTSGASGDGVATGAFGAWRGSPATVAGTWDDGAASVQETLPTLTGPLASWKGDLDVAVGGTVLGSGESYAAAASGAYQSRWTAMAQNLQRVRGDKPGITYVRPFHEFNGNWYKIWQVTPANLSSYRAAFRRLAGTIRAACPRCKIVWSPNNGTSAGSASPLDAYPGDDVVDVVGVDSYNANGNTVVTSTAAWQVYANATRGSIPVGVEAWRAFAQSHGKPLSLPEWGLNHGAGGGDNPAYIQGMHGWITQHAAQPGDADVSGKVVYDVYFNVAMGGNTGYLIKDGPNTQAAKAYTSLAWGNSPAW